MFWIGLILWFAIGVAYLRFTSKGTDEGGWLLMLSDRRSARHPKIAILALVVCWMAWPVYILLPKVSIARPLFLSLRFI